MIVDLPKLKAYLEGRIREEPFHQELSGALDSTIIVLEYLQAHSDVLSNTEPE